MITKRIIDIIDRKSRSLETVICARRILLLECHGRCFSYMTKSLKTLNLKQTVDCNLLEVAEKPFQRIYNPELQNRVKKPS